MRIIAGQLKSLAFKSPNGHRTHPMSDKVRGALFNALGDIDGLSVLDPFSGSGALSFEALSRGAANATLIEYDKNAQKVITENLEELDLTGKAKLIKAGANAWLSTTDQQFDLVLLDPPYDDLQPNLLHKLAARAKIDGVVVLSLPPAADFRLPAGFDQLTTRDYGDATLAFYRRIA